jgi:hypothetical protein
VSAGKKPRAVEKRKRCCSVGIGRQPLRVSDVSACLFLSFEVTGDNGPLPGLRSFNRERAVRLADDAVVASIGGEYGTPWHELV